MHMIKRIVLSDGSMHANKAVARKYLERKQSARLSKAGHALTNDEKGNDRKYSGRVEWLAMNVEALRDLVAVADELAELEAFDPDADSSWTD